MRHITGKSRQQVTLDMKVPGFSKAQTCISGRKPYHPGDLLKLYIYGYLNQARSSRRLEKECHRNLELLWLMKRLAPDFKTISDFRKDNSDGSVLILLKMPLSDVMPDCKKILA